jgi:hypothetical protein
MQLVMLTGEVVIVVDVAIVEHHDHEQPFLVAQFEFFITFEAEALCPTVYNFCRRQQLGSRHLDGRWRCGRSDRVHQRGYWGW